jgi:hypothetical protein
MPWTVKLSLSQEVISNRKGFTKKGSVYPTLPSILDDETLTELTTFESGETLFLGQHGRKRRQYLTALYLKVISSLGHSHVQPKNLPLQFRRGVLDRLNFDRDLSKIHKVDKAEKSRIVKAIRVYLGLSVPEKGDLENLKLWIINTVAHKENDDQMLISAAVQYLKNNKFELPNEKELLELVNKAINEASSIFISTINTYLKKQDKNRLFQLTKGSSLEGGMPKNPHKCRINYL